MRGGRAGGRGGRLWCAAPAVGGGSIVVLTPWAELTHKHTPLPSPTPAEGIAERVRAYRHAAVAHGTPGLPAELASLEAAVASLQQRLLSS